MDMKRSYLAGDIHTLEKVNKIVPRKMELPLLMQSRIQIRRNLFGIQSRFFEHMKSYDYKFKSLAAEPKQVLRALRPRSSCMPRPYKLPKPTPIQRTLEDPPWKLPPNVYRLKNHFEEVSKKQMGKLGPYQCFTVERDVKTIISRRALRPAKDQLEIVYDVPSGIDELMTRSCNRYKAKFLKGERFEKVSDQNIPPPTQYYPQNYVLKPKTLPKFTASAKKPIFYYPNTSVPVKETSYNKEGFANPAPGRYDPHDITCKCYLKENSKRCPGNVIGNGHSHVFKSNIFRLVGPVKLDKRRFFSAFPEDDSAIQYFPRSPREPISFRVRRSMSVDSLTFRKEREVRFNTMVKKRNLFSVKTGRPVGFLAASPRFKEKSKISLKIEKEKNKMMLSFEEQEKPPKKPMSKERLEQLAAPKNPLPKIKRDENQPTPQSPVENVKKVSIESPSGVSEIAVDDVDEHEQEATTDDEEAVVTRVNLESEKAVESTTTTK